MARKAATKKTTERGARRAAKARPKAASKPKTKTAARKGSATVGAGTKARASRAAALKKGSAQKPATAEKSAAKKPAAKKAAGKAKAAPKKAAPARKPAKAAVATKPEPPPKPVKPKKSPYTKRQLKPLRAALLVLRARLVGDIDLMGREALRADEADVDAENMADHGTDAFERNMTLELMENESRTLRLIDDALDTMNAGHYGLCNECGENIVLVRLEALPFAQTCVPCQEVQERSM